MYGVVLHVYLYGTECRSHFLTQVDEQRLPPKRSGLSVAAMIVRAALIRRVVVVVHRRRHHRMLLAKHEPVDFPIFCKSLPAAGTRPTLGRNLVLTEKVFGMVTLSRMGDCAGPFNRLATSGVCTQ